MKKLLLVYAPFCTPASPPYSLVHLASFLRNNCEIDVEILDLNLEFHHLRFSSYGEFFRDSSKWGEYDFVSKKYAEESSHCYSENNKRIRRGESPELFDEMLGRILERKADWVAFSIVYSSQAFYAHSLLGALKGVETIVGGPAINHALIASSKHHLKNEVELLEFITGKEVQMDSLKTEFPLEFPLLDLKRYFVPDAVVPIKTSSTCYHKKCTFCSHYARVPYVEFPLHIIEETIRLSKARHVFLIDDMIPAPRLRKIGEMMRRLGVVWGCQLRPTKEFNYALLHELHSHGLRFVIWGVESGCDRILTLMKKGTNVADVSKVLLDSKKAGIVNVTYIMFGFPTETKEEFVQTIDFLKAHAESIDLVSPSVFGLQQGAPAFDEPQSLGITKVTLEERELLPPKVMYEVSSGLTQEEANEMRSKYRKSIAKLSRLPKHMNFFREHVFFAE